MSNFSLYEIPSGLRALGNFFALTIFLCINTLMKCDIRRDELKLTKYICKIDEGRTTLR